MFFKLGSPNSEHSHSACVTISHKQHQQQQLLLLHRAEHLDHHQLLQFSSNKILRAQKLKLSTFAILTLARVLMKKSSSITSMIGKKKCHIGLLNSKTRMRKTNGSRQPTISWNSLTLRQAPANNSWTLGCTQILAATLSTHNIS